MFTNIILAGYVVYSRYIKDQQATNEDANTEGHAADANTEVDLVIADEGGEGSPIQVDLAIPDEGGEGNPIQVATREDNFNAVLGLITEIGFDGDYLYDI